MWKTDIGYDLPKNFLNFSQPYNKTALGKVK